MALPTTCTLVYTCEPTNATGAELVTAMENVVLYDVLAPGDDPVLFVLFDCTVNSDVTAISGGNAVRTIVLGLGTGFFDLFPTAPVWATAFLDYFTHSIALGMPATVEFSAPVFA